MDIHLALLDVLAAVSNLTKYIGFKAADYLASTSCAVRAKVAPTLLQFFGLTKILRSFMISSRVSFASTAKRAVFVSGETIG